MSLVGLKTDLKRYSLKSRYTLLMAISLVIDRGYTLQVDNNNPVNHRIMYEGRNTGVSLIATTHSWFVV